MKIYEVIYKTRAYVFAESEGQVEEVLRKNVKDIIRVTDIDLFSNYNVEDYPKELQTAVKELDIKI